MRVECVVAVAVGVLATNGTAPAENMPSPQSSAVRTAGFQTRAAIDEIAASARSVAVLLSDRPGDCGHVEAWTVGRRATVRFSRRGPCDPWVNEHLLDVSLEGRTVEWSSVYCANDCYHTRYRESLSRPGMSDAYFEEAYENTLPGPHAPLPPVETRRGVRVSVSKGAVVLRRTSDGRVRRIRPRGAVVVDAELEDVGLFYAYSLESATRRGTLVFLPFARLFPG